MNTPKVLIVGQSFNNNTGGGVTLSNLFSGWPEDKIAVICSGYELQHNTNLKICTNYYQLGHHEQKWIFPFNLIKRKYPSGRVQFQGEKEYHTIENPSSPLRLNIIKNIFIPFLQYTGISHFSSRLELSLELKHWLDDFAPDILYCQASSLPDINFCLSVYDYAKKPMTFHMMDDWPSIIPGSGLFGRYWYKQIDKSLRNIFRRSTLLLSICESMSEAYGQKYGHSFVPFHNPINIAFWSKKQRSTYELSKNPVILYAGRTGLGIETSLILVAKAISLINRRWKSSIKLVLQTPEKPTWTTQYQCISHRHQVPYDQLPSTLSRADLLLLPYDFSKKSVKYIKYSMPTKASEFMASGTPIIALGPGETAVMKYAKKYRWAETITDKRIHKIALGIQSLLEDESKRYYIANNAKSIARQYHDQKAISNSFKQLLAGTGIENIESKTKAEERLTEFNISS